MLEAGEHKSLINRKLSQMKLLTYSLSGLYISAALMVLSGLVSFSSRFDVGSYLDLSSGILLTGVGFIFLSLIILIIYSAKAVNIRRAHFDDCLIKEK